MTMSNHQELAGKPVLVTGASGFIGSALVRRLNDVGAVVYGISRLARKSDGKTRWLQSDLLSIEEVQRIVDEIRPRVVFHLASQVTGLRSIDAVLPIFQSNLVTTVNLLAALTGRDCERVVLTGSLEEPTSAEVAPVPCSPYAAAKFSASAYGRMFNGLYNLPVVILKLFMVYGPAQQDVKKLVPYVILSLLQGRAPELSAGLREIDWVYVDDVVDAYLSSAVAKGISGRTIDIGSGTLVTTRSIVERLVDMIDPEIRPKFGAIPERPMEQVRVADPTQAAALLGWEPQTSLSEGLRRTIDWYRAGVHASVSSIMQTRNGGRS